MRVMFVDDEARVLGGIERTLFGRAPSWQVDYCTDPNEALRRVEASHYDVVVSDMRMPEMDGAELLRRVHRCRPDTVRVILTGQSEEEAALRALDVAHRFLCKPCRTDLLIETIERLMAQRARLTSPHLAELVGKVARLGSAPATYAALTRIMDDPDSDARAIAEIVCRDPAIAAKVLHLSNSAFFSGGREIVDLRAAVSRLGLRTLRHLVLATEVFAPDLAPHVDVAAMQRRAISVSALAAKLLRDPSLAAHAATAGLLADIALLLPDVDADTVHDGVPLHAEAGGYLVALWGMPQPIVDALLTHHTPRCSGRAGLDVAGAVHIAAALIADEPIDPAYIAAAGLTAELPDYRKMADGIRSTA